MGVRLARRELWRRPLRTLLVVTMVLLPTGAMTLIATYLRTSEWSPRDQARAAIGRADTSVAPVRADSDVVPGPEAWSATAIDGLRSRLPAGTRVLVERAFSDRVRLEGRRAYFTVSDVPLLDPMVDGRFASLRGRAPAGPGELALSEESAHDLGVGLGDVVHLDRLARDLTVVGITRPKAWPTAAAFVARPADEALVEQRQVWVDLPGRPIDPDERGRARIDPVTGLLPGLPVVDGWRFDTRIWSSGPDKTEALFWTYLGGGMGLIVLGTIIAAAFAVSARRQLRTLGLLSATGTPPSTVRWFLVLQGAVTGVVGSIVGVGLGVAAAELTPLRYLDSLAAHPVSGAVVRAADLVPIVLIGVAAAAGAAWLPSRSVARVPALQALAGRRPLPRVPSALPLSGLVSIAGGCALFAMAVAGSGQARGSSLWALVAVAGGLACLAGVLAVAPWAVARLEGPSRSWPGSLRLAARSLARNRVRSSAVVGAICVVASVAIAGSTIYNSINVEPRGHCCVDSLPYLRDDQLRLQSYYVNPSRDLQAVFRSRPAGRPDDVLRRIDEIASGGQAVQLSETLTARSSARPDDYRSNLELGVASPDLLDALDVPARLRRVLDVGSAVAVVRSAPGERELRVALPVGEGVAPQERVVRLGGSFTSPRASRSLPQVLVSRATADGLGLALPMSAQWLVQLPEPIDRGQQDALEVLREDVIWEQNVGMRAGRSPAPDATAVYFDVPTNATDVPQALLKAAALAIALLLVLGVVAVGLAMAAKDSEDERQVLTAVGAPPSVLRRVAAARAVLLVSMAAVIAVPTALLPAFAVVAASPDVSSRFRPDVWAIAFVVLAVPAVTWVATAVWSRLRDLARPTRPEVFAFTD